MPDPLWPHGLQPTRLFCPWDFLGKDSYLRGFPGSTSGKEPTCQCRRHKRCGFDSWVRKIPWQRAWQPTPVILPGESHGQRSLVGLQFIESQRVRHDWSDFTRMHAHSYLTAGELFFILSSGCVSYSYSVFLLSVFFQKSHICVYESSSKALVCAHLYFWPVLWPLDRQSNF